MMRAIETDINRNIGPDIGSMLLNPWIAS